MVDKPKPWEPRRMLAWICGRFERESIAAGKGWTQEEFAVRSGLTQQYISGLESRHRNPTISSLFELAQALTEEIDGLLRFGGG